MKIWKEKGITFSGAVQALQSCALFWCSAVLALLTFLQKVAAFKLSLRTCPSLRMRGVIIISSYSWQAPVEKSEKNFFRCSNLLNPCTEQRCNAEPSVLVRWKPISSLRLLALTLCPTVNFRNLRCSGVWMRSSWVFMNLVDLWMRSRLAWMRSSQIFSPYALCQSRLYPPVKDSEFG
jgi:hypothetical protein